MSRRYFRGLTLSTMLMIIAVMSFIPLVNAQYAKGEVLLGWPVPLKADPYNARIGDIDASYPGPEIAFMPQDGRYVEVYNWNGSKIWEYDLGMTSSWSRLDVANIDNDPELEVIVAASNSTGGIVFFLDNDGSLIYKDEEWIANGYGTRGVGHADLFDNGTTFVFVGGTKGVLRIYHYYPNTGTMKTSDFLTDSRYTDVVRWVGAGNIFGTHPPYQVVADALVWNISNPSTFEVTCLVALESPGVSYMGSVSDVDGDGYDEIVRATTNVVIYDYTGKAERTYSVGVAIHCVITRDVDGDGLEDIIWGDTNGRIGVINGTCYEILPKKAYTSGEVVALYAGDTDGDGYMEVIWCNKNGGLHSLDINTRTFVWNYTDPSWSETNWYFWYMSGTIADVNGDGLEEVVFGCKTTATYRGYLICAPKPPEFVSWEPQDGYATTKITITFNLTTRDYQSGLVQVNITIFNVTAGNVLVRSYTVDILPPQRENRTSITVSGFEEGEYFWNATAKDRAGNVAHSPLWTFYVDRTPPTCNAISPSPSSVNPRTVTFQVDASDALSGVENVIVKVWNDTWSTTLDAAYNPSTGYYECACPLGNGTYRWYANATDKAGNVGQSSTITFYVDGYPPATTLEAPDQGQMFLDSASASAVDFNATVTDSGGVQWVKLYIDGVYRGDMNPVGGNRYHLRLDLSAEEGNHTWYVNASDNVGNIGISETRWFVIDLKPPEITHLSPVDNSYTNNRTVIIKARIYDAAGLKSATLYLNGTPHTMQKVSGYVYEARVEVPSEGKYFWYINATDIADRENSTKVAQWSFIVDWTKPAADMVCPVDDEYTNQATVMFNVTAHDNRVLDRIELYIDWSYEGLMTYDPSTGYWTYSASLPEGSHRWYVIVYDKAGNAFQTTAYTVTVDLTAPSIALEAPANGTISPTSRVEFVVSASDNFGIDSVYLYINGSYYGVMSFNGTHYVLTASLADGYYEWSAVAYDLAGNPQPSVVWQLIVDTTPPSGRNFSPSDGYVSSSSSVTFVVNATDNVRYAGSPLVSQVLLYVKDLSSGTVNTYTMTYDSTTETATYTLTLGDGDYEWWVKVQDYAGHTYETDHYALTVDTTAPTVSQVAPSDGAVYGTSGVTFVVTASDLTLDEIALYIDGKFYGYMSFNGTHYVLAVSLGEGTHSWYVIAYDEAGHSTTSSSRTVSIDLTAPSVSITSPSEGAWVNSTSVTVSWTGSDALAGIDHYEVSTDGTTWTNVGTATSYTLTLSEGVNTVYVKAVDKVGNYATTTVTINVDLTSPTVSLVSPEDLVILPYSTIQFVASASDNGVIAQVVLYVDGTPYTMVLADGKYVFTLSYVSEGSHTWYVRVIDAAGNAATSSTRSFVVDVTPPSVTSAGPASGSVYAETSVSVWVNCSDDFGPMNVTFYVDSIPVGSVIIATPAGSASMLLNLTEGVHSWYVMVCDGAGHSVSTVPRSIVIDVSKPVFVTASVTPGTFVNGTEVTLYVNFTDNMAIDRVELWIDGECYGVMPYDASTGYYRLTITLANGTHTWFARAYDKAGNYVDSPSQTITMSWPVAAKVPAVAPVVAAPPMIAWVALGVALAALIGVIAILIIARVAVSRKSEEV